MAGIELTSVSVSYRADHAEFSFGVGARWTVSTRTQPYSIGARVRYLADRWVVTQFSVDSAIAGSFIDDEDDSSWPAFALSSATLRHFRLSDLTHEVASWAIRDGIPFSGDGLDVTMFPDSRRWLEERESFLARSAGANHQMVKAGRHPISDGELAEFAQRAVALTRARGGGAGVIATLADELNRSLSVVSARIAGCVDRGYLVKNSPGDRGGYRPGLHFTESGET